MNIANVPNYLNNVSTMNLSTSYWSTNNSLVNASNYLNRVSIMNLSTTYWLTNNSLANVCTSLDTIIINVHDTAITVGLALGEVNALAAALGLSMTLNTAGEFIEMGALNSDTGEFSESVSSTDAHCTNLRAYNSGQIDGDLGCNGYLHCLNTVFCETVDTDF